MYTIELLVSEDMIPPYDTAVMALMAELKREQSDFRLGDYRVAVAAANGVVYRVITASNTGEYVNLCTGLESVGLVNLCREGDPIAGFRDFFVPE